MPRPAFTFVRTAALIIRDGHILLTPPWATDRGSQQLWEAPGGALEPGESLEDALRREAKAEIGAEIEPCGIAYVVQEPVSETAMRARPDRRRDDFDKELEEMARNPFGHVDLRVRDLEAATPFYTKLLPALGFSRTFRSPQWHVFATEGDLPGAAYVALTEDAAHVPSANRLAFWVESREKVDELAEIARAAGARDLEGPEAYPVSPTYYSVFLNDPSGNRFEIYYRRN